MATFTVTTKADAKSPSVKTVLTVNMGKPEVRDALALQALVVKWQATARKNGIPPTATINMDDFAPGTRHSAQVDPLAVAKSMTAEERAALIAQIQAMNAAQ